MASGHRKRKASLVRLKVLDPIQQINANENDRGKLINQNNLVNLAIYSKGGFSPTFNQGSTSLLSNAISNADGLWSLAGLIGESTDYGTFRTGSMDGVVGLFTNSKHYMFPSITENPVVDLTGPSWSGGPLIIYSYDGPQANYVPYYIDQNFSGEQIFALSNKVTGSGSPTHISVYVAGGIPSTELILFQNSDLELLKGKCSIDNFTSANNFTTASGADLAASNNRRAFIIPTASVTGGLYVRYTQTLNQSWPSTNFKGFFIAIGSGSYP